MRSYREAVVQCGGDDLADKEFIGRGEEYELAEGDGTEDHERNDVGIGLGIDVVGGDRTGYDLSDWLSAKSHEVFIHTAHAFAAPGQCDQIGKQHRPRRRADLRGEPPREGVDLLDRSAGGALCLGRDQARQCVENDGFAARPVSVDGGLRHARLLRNAVDVQCVDAALDHEREGGVEHGLARTDRSGIRRFIGLVRHIATLP
jgi:hypothetical protein